MPNFPQLKKVLWQHMGFFAVLLFMASIFMAAGGGVFWFDSSPIRYMGILFALFVFAFISTYSSCCYYYEREVLKKYGVKTQARLIGKVDESSAKNREPLFRLQYIYQWQGRNYEGEELIEDKALFDALLPSMGLPIVVLKHSPKVSTLQMTKLKQIVRNAQGSDTA